MIESERVEERQSARTVIYVVTPTKYNLERICLTMKTEVSRAATVLSLILWLGACGSSSDSASTQVDTGAEGESAGSGESSVGDTEAVIGSMDVNQFIDGALLADATIVDCTLNGGAETTCYQLEIQGVPAGDAEIGPFCPGSITTSAEEAGVWFDGGGQVYDLDGDFIVNLPNLYGDINWNLYDTNTGLVKVTDTQVACEGAAQPNVEEQYKNMCVECSLDYYNGGITQTVLIPTTPIPAEAGSAIGNSDVGVALNGVILAAAAPVSDILANYTIAAFDDCGGHINPNAGYHYHASTDCNTVGEQSDDHASLMAYAMDGYGIYGQLDAVGNEHTDLDECRGATDEIRGYHYHAASAWENTFIGCFSGQIEGQDAGINRPPPR